MIHRLPDFVIAVLACWLGLSLLVRSPRDATARAFAWLCVNLALYGLTPVLSLLTTRLEVALVLDRLQVLATLTTPVAFLHFLIVLTGNWPPRGWLRLVLLGFYLAALVLGLFVLWGPLDLSSYRDYLRDPRGAYRPWAPWGETQLPTPALQAAWTVQRVVPHVLALFLLGRSWRREADGLQARRQRLFLVLAAVIGVLGAVGATTARSLQLSPAPGRVLIVLALAALAYAVLAYRSLLPARIAQRTFVYSLLGGLITIGYVTLLLGMEWLARRVLSIDAPVLTAVALVALVALFGPLREAIGARLDRRFFRREFNYSRLIGALNSDLLSGDPDEQVETLLSGVCRGMSARAGMIAVQRPEGLRVVASYGASRPDEWALREVAVPHEPSEGQWAPWPAARLVLPLRHEREPLGLLALGPRRSEQPYQANDIALLGALTSYLTVVVAHQRIREQQQQAVAQLTAQGRELQVQQEQLAQQATAALDAIGRESTAAQPGLRVYCLGPLRVERDGEPISRWGGEKAGTRQAEALFAVLFDRRGRGLTKDEAEELIWPDLPLDKADTAFHRTLSALRRTLEPTLRRGNESRAVPYHHERYWLEPALVAWTDSDCFVERVAQGQRLLSQRQHAEAIEAFQQAIALYRGAYMDDCPFFGDSAQVEERRAELHTAYVDSLLALGTALEQQGRGGEALTSYRRALGAAEGDCSRAEEAIARCA